MNSPKATVVVFLGLLALLGTHPAQGEPWRFAFMADDRSNFTGSGVNTAGVTAIAQQISRRDDIQLVLVGGDLMCGEDRNVFEPPPTMPAQFQSFTNAMSAGGLKPAGTLGRGISFYAVRGNHETHTMVSNQFVAWNDAYGQNLPQNGPTTGNKTNSEVGMTYSFQSNGATFIGVDEYANAPSFMLPTVNQPWVDAQLAGNQGYVFAFGHAPVYMAGQPTCLAWDRTARDNFLNSLYNSSGPGGHGGVVYFCGHDHFNALSRVYAGGEQRFYQMLVGGGGAPLETFNGVYNRDFPTDNPVTGFYYDSGNGIPYHFSYAVVSVDGESLWMNLYGTANLNEPTQGWQLLYSVVMRGSMTTTARELGASGVANDAQVIFNQWESGTYSGVMQGLGSLVKTGPGALELTGANTYIGGTIIQQGLLSVNNTEGSGTGSGTVLVQPAGILGGSGRIGGDVINQGTIAPGNSIGTLTINGNYIQTAGSTYAAEVDDQGHSDLIHVTGVAAITGGTVNVQPQTGNYTAGMTYRILQADGGVSGTFDRVVTNLPSYHGVLRYDSDDVFLSLLRYADFARTRNQFAVATYLDDIQPSATGDLSNVLTALDTQTGDQARTAFNQLAGEPYADLGSIDVAGSNLFTDTAFYRLWNIDDFDDNCTKGRKLWAYGIGNWQRQQSTSASAGWDAYSGYNNQIAGFMIGYDKQFDNVLLGFGSGYGRSDATFLGSPAQDETDLFNFSGYGRADFGPVYVAGVAGYTHGWNDVTRSIQFGGLASRRATGSVNGDLFGTLLQTGYNIDLGNFRITPLGGLRYVHGSMGGTTETGADSVNLSVAGYGCDSLASHFGSKLAFLLTQRWRAEAYGQWEHDYADLDSRVAMAFTGSPSTGYIVQGVARGRDGARTGLVTIGKINDHASMHLNYDALLQSSYASQQFTGGLSLGF